MCDYIGSKFGNYEIFVYEVKTHEHTFQNYLTKNELASMAPTYWKDLKFLRLQLQKIKYSETSEERAPTDLKFFFHYWGVHYREVV